MELEINFQRMEECGKVDPYLEVTLEKIDNITKEILSIKENKLNETNLLNNFNYHHLSNVSLIILDTMKKRLINSKKNMDNPKIALDSLEILPMLSIASEKLKLRKSDETFIEIATELQSNATQVNLFNLNRENFKDVRSTINEIVREASVC